MLVGREVTLTNFGFVQRASKIVRVAAALQEWNGFYVFWL